jgi:hypothetical protein
MAQTLEGVFTDDAEVYGTYMTLDYYVKRTPFRHRPALYETMRQHPNPIVREYGFAAPKRNESMDFIDTGGNWSSPVQFN